MNDVDWSAKAVVHSRSDGGSDMDVNFDRLREGPLDEMVRSVAILPAAERARIIMDVEGRGNLDIGQIMTLAAQLDAPAG
jgi:hypothetical protein